MHPTAGDKKSSRSQLPPWILPPAVALAVTCLFQAAVPVAANVPDALDYRRLASGLAVPRPFAFRILAPHLAASLASLTHHSQDWGFLAEGTVCIFLFVLCLAIPVLHARGSLGARLALLTGVLATPIPSSLWSHLYLPDLLHATLTAIYLLLLRARFWTLAAGVLPFLFLARESSLLLAVVAVLVLSRLASRRAAILHAAGALAGWALSQRAGSYGLANERGLGNTFYLLGKVPHNLLKNILGVVLWTEPLDGPRPALLWTLPSWLHAGHLRQIGYSSFRADLIWVTLLAILTSFGVGLALALLLPVRRAHLWHHFIREPWLLIAAVYGLLSFVLAPALGASLDRLLNYGWPLFLFAVPLCLLHLLRRPMAAGYAVLLLLLHAGLGQMPSLIFFPSLRNSLLNSNPHLVAVVGAVVCLTTVADLVGPCLLVVPARTNREPQEKWADPAAAGATDALP